jgi:phenylacetate-CoA ligase
MKTLYTSLAVRLLGLVSWKSYHRHLIELERTQWEPAESLMTRQLSALRSLLDHAVLHVPYYRRRFAEWGITPKAIKTFDDLKAIPRMDRSTVREHLPELLAENIPPSQTIQSRTGGTTGGPMVFYYDRRYHNLTKAAMLRAFSWAGLRVGTRHAMLWNNIPDLQRETKALSRIRNLVLNRCFLDGLDLSPEQVAKTAQIIRTFRPQVLYGYSSILSCLAQWVLENYPGQIRPNSVISTAEKLFPMQRRLIESAFGAPVFDMYGSREMMTLAMECPAHRGLHVNTDLYLIEITRDGQPVKVGEEGEITVTSLYNRAMPFIRYRIGDVGRLLPDQCPCGRSQPLLEITQGRVFDIVVLPSGRRLHGDFFYKLIYETLLRDGEWRTMVMDFQVVQDQPDHLTITLVRGPGFHMEDADLLLTRLRKAIGAEATISLRFADRIERSPSGKYRPVLSLVRNNG